MTDEMLQEQGNFFKNHELLNDCKITKEFIRLESRKNGYNNVVRLTTKNNDGEVTDSITDPEKIRKKWHPLFKPFLMNKKWIHLLMQLKIT